MEHLYDLNTPKRATNVTVNSDLLDAAKKFHINLSATLEQALVELVRQKRREQWRVENQDAIAEYNVRIEKQGVFSDDVRSF